MARKVGQECRKCVCCGGFAGRFSRKRGLCIHDPIGGSTCRDLRTSICSSTIGGWSPLVRGVSCRSMGPGPCRFGPFEVTNTGQGPMLQRNGRPLTSAALLRHFFDVLVTRHVPELRVACFGLHGWPTHAGVGGDSVADILAG